MRSGLLGFVALPLFLFAGNALAACGGSLVLNASAAVTDKTFCVPKAGGGFEYQEEFVGGGALWDYKLGSDSSDPRTQMGTWSASTTDGTVTFNYGTGGIHTFTLYQTSTGYCLQGTGGDFKGTLKNNTNVGCP